MSIALLHPHGLSYRRLRTHVQRLWCAVVTLVALVLLCTPGQPAQGNTLVRVQGAIDPDVVLVLVPAHATVALANVSPSRSGCARPSKSMARRRT